MKIIKVTPANFDTATLITTVKDIAATIPDTCLVDGPHTVVIGDFSGKRLMFYKDVNYNADVFLATEPKDNIERSITYKLTRVVNEALSPENLESFIQDTFKQDNIL